ncbi:methyltransferase, TIGR04325 family [Candidatus Pelagibacter ubique]|nr:methyltransferase, TIGR04325 family [Candidatus Pelagibacter ubique]
MKKYLRIIFNFFKKNIHRIFFSEIKWSIKNYSNWDEALKKSDGYNDQKIIKKVNEAASQVIEGKASYERDGAVFNKKEYSYEILSSFLYYLDYSKNLKVADVGGSLGSMYFQYKDILEKRTDKLFWEIFEQENFVKVGNERFANQDLKFNEIKNISSDNSYDITIFGSVLNYLENYSSVFDNFCKISNCIIVDRTSFTKQKKIKIQKIKEYPYTSSYPHITFPKQELEEILKKNNFNIIFEWPSISIMSAPFKFEGFMALKND